MLAVELDAIDTTNRAKNLAEDTIDTTNRAKNLAENIKIIKIK